MVRGRIEGCDSREDDVERWREQEEGVTVFDDIIGKCREGWVHWSRGLVSARRRASKCLVCVEPSRASCCWSRASERRRRGRRCRSSGSQGDAIASTNPRPWPASAIQQTGAAWYDI